LLAAVSRSAWPKIAGSIYLYSCYSDAMIQTRTQSMPQGNKIEQIEAALAKLLADLSQRGFYGEAGLTLSVQDGRIQHIRVAMERMIK
jgi:hypothetical protein